MKKQIKILSILFSLICIGFLTACHRTETEDDVQLTDTNSDHTQDKVNNQKSNSTPTKKAEIENLLNDKALMVKQDSTGNLVIQSRPIQAPVEYYTPSQTDVQKVLADILVSTVMKMPNTPERNVFYQNQANILQTLKVLSCSRSQAGTPSVCRIEMNNQQGNIKLMFTQQGWVFIK